MRHALVLAVLLLVCLLPAWALTVEQEAKLLPYVGDSQDLFGGNVALHGDTAVIGVTGDDDNGDESGSALVFTRTGNTWTQQAKLRASDGAEGDHFGVDIALDGDTAVIGAPNDDDGEDSGSAYVFRLYDDDVPATSVVGRALLLLAVLGTGIYLMRRRGTA
jgi:opacity protein-like surface antigen